MARLEELTPGASVQGILPDALVNVVSTQWFGSEALELTYKTPTGKVANELVYRHDEPRLEIAELGRPWSLDGDGSLFRLVSEAQRIRLAHLFDPVLAVHTSLVEPLPHRITAVYEAMLPRQPSALAALAYCSPASFPKSMARAASCRVLASGNWLPFTATRKRLPTSSVSSPPRFSLRHSSKPGWPFRVTLFS